MHTAEAPCTRSVLALHTIFFPTDSPIHCVSQHPITSHSYTLLLDVYRRPSDELELLRCATDALPLPEFKYSTTSVGSLLNSHCKHIRESPDIHHYRGGWVSPAANSTDCHPVRTCMTFMPGASDQVTYIRQRSVFMQHL